MAFIKHLANGGGWINTDHIEIVSTLNDHGSDDGNYHAWIGNDHFTIEKAVWIGFWTKNNFDPAPKKRRNARPVHADVLAALRQLQAVTSQAAAMGILRKHGKADKLSAVEPRRYAAIIREAEIMRVAAAKKAARL